MHTLYDSDTFSVTHLLANAPHVDATPSGAPTLLTSSDTDSANETACAADRHPLLARHGFEIVDKRSGKEVYLDGSWAELFQQHIMAWQQKTPTQEEVEDTLDQYAGLAQNPVVVH